MKKLLCVLFVLALLPIFSFAEDIEIVPAGKWSYCYDVRNVPGHDSDEIQYLSFDLFLFEDYTCYCFMGSIHKGDSEMNISYSDGLWLGDPSWIKIKTKKFVFDAYMNEPDIFNLYFTDTIVFNMQRISPVSTI